MILNAAFTIFLFFWSIIFCLIFKRMNPRDKVFRLVIQDTANEIFDFKSYLKIFPDD